MDFICIKEDNILNEIYKIIAINDLNPKLYEVSCAIYNLIIRNGYTIFGSIIHRLITKTIYNIDNIDILIGPYDRKIKDINGCFLNRIFLKNANRYQFSKHIISHDILLINNIKINYIYINIIPYDFILAEIPHYFLKNFYFNGYIYTFKLYLMLEIRLYCNYRNKIIQKYMQRGVKFKSLN